ncbi:MAG: hypothetical protein K9L22_11475, partial [Methylococcaceae bacterium]|nr:hypothetical protein [Methylococcaceae bacterium]
GNSLGMITKDNFNNVLEKLAFTMNKNEAYKKFDDFDCELRVDFKNAKLIYPESNGLIINPLSQKLKPWNNKSPLPKPLLSKPPSKNKWF